MLSAVANEPPQAPATALGDAETLLADYAMFCAALHRQPQSRRLRRQGAERLLAARPDFAGWMLTPSAERLTEIRRRDCWPFLTWLFCTGRLVPDLDLLMGKGKGAHFTSWGRDHRADVERAQAAGRQLGWGEDWTVRVGLDALALVCLTRSKTLLELTAEDLDAVGDELTSSPQLSPGRRRSALAQHYGLRLLCFQLHLTSAPPRPAGHRQRTLGTQVAGISQPELRRAAQRYLETVATTLRPSTVDSRAASLNLLSGWLAANHPHVQQVSDLTRAHLEAFLAHDRGRSWRGRVARDQQISLTHHAHTVIDLRAFLDDIAVWGWADRPTCQLLHRSDIPRLPQPLPRALGPDVDVALMTAVHDLDDIAARTGLLVLRGTGMRLGELMDLELGCLWDLPSHGTWIKVPLGKLNTERVVPLDAPTLAALDEWMAVRGRQRALPHPRHGQATDFLFTLGGRRMGTARIRRGLATAVVTAGLLDPSGQPLRITPHQLRHTYATTLVNAGMNLQALMALLGHVTPEMTLRYAALSSGTVRGAYEAAMVRVRERRQLPLVVAGSAKPPERIEWLRSEMLKTRVAHGYCSRHLAAEACPYANICEQCDNYVTTSDFAPALQAQLEDTQVLHDDAQARGWDSEVARHARVITSISGHLARLRAPEPRAIP